MPIILMHCGAIALAATVTMWFAPVAFWQKSEPAGNLPVNSPSRIRETQTLNGLHIRREGLK